MGSEPILFLRRWLKDPLMIGAIAPSSRELAAAMARLVPVDSQDPVIELGGGTGVITQALLDAGIAPARLFVVERDGALHDLLVKRFPEVRILLGSAADLTDLLRPLGVAKACAVVSGLPLLAMRDSAAQAGHSGRSEEPRAQQSAAGERVALPPPGSDGRLGAILP